MEELILRYYLGLFSILLLLAFSVNILIYEKIYVNEKIIVINKGQDLKQIFKDLDIKKNFFKKNIYLISLIFSNKYISTIKYGKFNINKDITFINLLKLISNTSNLNYKITIVDGWQTYQVNQYLNNYYDKNIDFKYEKIFADTYSINSSNSIHDLKKFIEEYTKKSLLKLGNNVLLDKFTIKELLIISSLVEKEGKSIEDKKIISSVIFNRLKKNMKLQIDASVIYAITEGKRHLKRSLTYSDLKINHPYNTYHVKGLPPGMICYVSLNTLKLVLENNKSDFLFYFYNIIEKKHIFSKTYEKHKSKLNEYRKKTK